MLNSHVRRACFHYPSALTPSWENEQKRNPHSGMLILPSLPDHLIPAFLTQSHIVGQIASCTAKITTTGIGMKKGGHV